MLCVFSDFNELVFVSCKQKYFFESLSFFFFQIGVSGSSEELSLLNDSLWPECLWTIFTILVFFFLFSLAGTMTLKVCPF